MIIGPAIFVFLMVLVCFLPALIGCLVLGRRASSRGLPHLARNLCEPLATKAGIFGAGFVAREAAPSWVVVGLIMIVPSVLLLPSGLAGADCRRVFWVGLLRWSMTLAFAHFSLQPALETNPSWWLMLAALPVLYGTWAWGAWELRTGGQGGASARPSAAKTSALVLSALVSVSLLEGKAWRVFETKARVTGVVQAGGSPAADVIVSFTRRGNLRRVSARSGGGGKFTAALPLGRYGIRTHNPAYVDYQGELDASSPGDIILDIPVQRMPQRR